MVKHTDKESPMSTTVSTSGLCGAFVEVRDEDRDEERIVYRECNEPAAYIIDGKYRRCDRHFTDAMFWPGDQRPSRPWAIACSVCERPVQYRSHLDESARCVACQP